LPGLLGQKTVQLMLLNQLKATLEETLAGPFQLDRIRSLVPLVSAHLSSWVQKEEWRVQWTHVGSCGVLVLVGVWVGASPPAYTGVVQ